MTSPSFYVLLPSGAVSVSGSIYVQPVFFDKKPCQVVFSPEPGMTTILYGGSENNCKSFLGALMYRLSHLGHSFPVIDMRDFKEVEND